MRQLKQVISAYKPQDAQEAEDQRIMLACMERFSDLLTRENELCHFTASGWVVNPSRTKVLMVFHNIYQSWSWTGGHADGESNLATVAMREVAEETGVNDLKLLDNAPISLEILTVEHHIKHGKPVSAHLHFNLTYLMEADDSTPLSVKADENSAVAWVPIEESARKSNEQKMHGIYEKLNKRVLESR